MSGYHPRTLWEEQACKLQKFAPVEPTGKRPSPRAKQVLFRFTPKKKLDGTARIRVPTSFLTGDFLITKK